MPEPTTINERMAVMEIELQHILKQNAARETAHAETSEKIDDVNKKMDTLLLQLEKYKGFLGGCLFVLSSLWVFIKMVIPYLLKSLGKEV